MVKHKEIEGHRKRARTTNECEALELKGMNYDIAVTKNRNK